MKFLGRKPRPRLSDVQAKLLGVQLVADPATLGVDEYIVISLGIGDKVGTVILPKRQGAILANSIDLALAGQEANGV